jgi:hypothetical protein
MISALVFWIILTLSSIIVFIFSNKYNIYFCIYLNISSSISGYIVLQNFNYNEFIFTFIADILIFIFCIFILVKSNRYWPIWFASFQFITLATHFASLVFSIEDSYYVFLFAGFWAIPALLSMAIGVILDYRSGIFRDEEWAWLRADIVK